MLQWGLVSGLYISQELASVEQLWVAQHLLPPLCCFPCLYLSCSDLALERLFLDKALQRNVTLCCSVVLFLHTSGAKWVTLWCWTILIICYVVFKGCPPWLTRIFAWVCGRIIHHCWTKAHTDILQFILKAKETAQLSFLKL